MLLSCIPKFRSKNSLQIIFYVFNFRGSNEPRKIFDNANFQIYGSCPPRAVCCCHPAKQLNCSTEKALFHLYTLHATSADTELLMKHLTEHSTCREYIGIHLTHVGQDSCNGLNIKPGIDVRKLSGDWKTKCVDTNTSLT